MKNRNISKLMKNRKTITGILCIACIGTLCMGCSGSKTAGGNNEPGTESIALGMELETETTEINGIVEGTEETEMTEVAEITEETTTEEQKNVVQTVAKAESSEKDTTTTNKTQENTSSNISKVNKTEETKKEETSNSSKQETTSSSSSKSENGENTKKEESKTTHSHDWKPVYKTVHHEAEYKTVHHEAEYKTVHHDAVVENQPYEEKYLYSEAWTEEVYNFSTYCFTCMSKGITVDLVKCAKEEGVTNQEYVRLHGAYHSTLRENCQYGNKNLLVDTIEHPAVYKTRTVDNYVTVKEAYDEKVLVRDAYDEKVLVKEAYDEQEITGYKCSCGATK